MTVLAVKRGPSLILKSLLVDSEPPGHSDIEIVDPVVVVAEEHGVQTQTLVTEREEFDPGSSVKVVVTGREHKVIRKSLRINIFGTVRLVPYLGAEIPFAYGPYCFADKAEVREEELFLVRGCPVDKVYIDEEVVGGELVAENEPIHFAAVYVFYKVCAPYCPPPGSESSVPVNIVRVAVLCTGRNRRRDKLKTYLLSGNRRIAHGRAESIILIETVAECSVIIYVDWGRIYLVAANQNSLLAGREGPFRSSLPAKIQKVGGIEGISLVDSLIEPLPDAE